MAEGVFTILYRQITSSQIPFPSSDALTGTNLANGTVINQTVGRYLNNPLFAGITLQVTGGGQSRMSICFGPEQEGKRVLLFITFSSTVYEFEVQIWAAGCWKIENPGNGPATPNSIFFGTPVNMAEPFPPGESVGGENPPPPYNPFIPWLLINIEAGTAACALADIIKVTVNTIPTVAIASATVYKDGLPTGITLSQLQAGVTFDQPGDYEVRITYQYLGDGTDQNPPGPPGEVLTRGFTISETPFPHMQRQSRVYGYVEPGEALLFDDALIDDGTIEYNALSGTFTLRFCGDYFIKWFIVTEMGMATDGSEFAIAVNGSTDITGSSHARVANNVGFSIVHVTAMPPTVQLLNMSDNIIELSKFTLVTAGIILYKIGDEMPTITAARIAAKGNA